MRWVLVLVLACIVTSTASPALDAKPAVRVAIIGSGISASAAAITLRRLLDPAEAEARLGSIRERRGRLGVSVPCAATADEREQEGAACDDRVVFPSGLFVDVFERAQAVGGRIGHVYHGSAGHPPFLFPAPCVLQAANGGTGAARQAGDAALGERGFWDSCAPAGARSAEASVELGASLIHTANEHMVGFVDALGLAMRERSGGGDADAGVVIRNDTAAGVSAVLPSPPLTRYLCR